MLRTFQLAALWLCFCFLICSFLGSCAPGFTPPLGGRDAAVSVVDCSQPQAGWIAEEVAYFGWHVATVGDVTITCGELDVALGEYFVGKNQIIIDLAHTHGLFETRAVAGHELVHWLIDTGPHPERVRYHVCSYALNDPAPPNCLPDVRAINVLMSPNAAPDPDTDWGMEAYTGAIAQYELTEPDLALIHWGLTP